VDQSLISQCPFSPKQKEKLESLEKQLDWEWFIDEYQVQSKLVAGIHRRLQAGCEKQPTTEDSHRSLNLKEVADFLAHISRCGEAALPRAVKQGLVSLGIKPRGRGRALGVRKKEALYSAYVKVVEEAIEETGVFRTKSELAGTSGKRLKFEQSLRREKWPVGVIDFLTTSKTPRIVAINIVADKFNCPYERIYRACLRSSKSDKK
jgi:hypothetical protein